MKSQLLKAVQVFLASLALLLMTTSAMNAEKKEKVDGSQAAFHQGSNTFGLGLGVGIGYRYYGDVSNLPAVFLSFDHGIIDNAGPGNIGIGAIFAVKEATYRYANGGYKSVWRNYIIAARGTWHLTVLADQNNRFDPYAGVTAGVRINTHDDTYYNLNSSPYDTHEVYPIGGAFIGVKYNFAKTVGVFAEAGYDISLFRAGLNFNF